MGVAIPNIINEATMNADDTNDFDMAAKKVECSKVDEVKPEKANMIADCEQDVQKAATNGDANGEASCDDDRLEEEENGVNSNKKLANSNYENLGCICMAR